MRRRSRTDATCCAALIAVAIAWDAAVAREANRIIDRNTHEDRLRAMWLGQVIANHTGRVTEGTRTEPPFLTDDDWATDPADGLPDAMIDFVFTQDPWQPDDDTDVEYMYIHLLTHHATTTLTEDQIADGWMAHINTAIWGSNEIARALMDRGVMPPETGLPVANERWLRVSNQLTTEVFGALAPGMPDKALLMADLPIRTTANGHAAHASQFHVLLYALGCVIGPGPVEPDDLLQLVRDARAFIPDSSKTADIIDVVVADYLANPDRQDWERTRDALFVRYRQHAPQHGFRYRGWFESTVNLGTGVMALLYGEGDYLRTVQIGTLSGWDADNPTATMGGLLGLILGYDELIAQLPPGTYSDRYEVASRRSNLPDRLPADPQADDTFAQLAERMGDIAERAVMEHHGLVDPEQSRWLLPPYPLLRTDLNPQTRRASRSANAATRTGNNDAEASLQLDANPPSGFGTDDAEVVVNGVEHDGTGYDPWPDDIARAFLSTQGSGSANVVLTVLYDIPVAASRIRMIEGDHFREPGADGGWFELVGLEVLEDGQWTSPEIVSSTPLDPYRPFQILDWQLSSERLVSGIRLTGFAGGADGFATIAEFDALAAEVEAPQRTFDFDGNGTIDDGDRLAWDAAPTDVNGDGVVTPADLHAVRAAICWPSIEGCADPCPCEADDVLGIDIADLLAFLTSWFAENIAADRNGNNAVDIDDFLIFLGCWFNGGVLEDACS